MFKPELDREYSSFSFSYSSGKITRPVINIIIIIDISNFYVSIIIII